MIYFKYDLETGYGLGVRKQSVKAGVPENTEKVGYLPIEEALAPQEWMVDLDTLALIPRSKSEQELDQENIVMLRALRDQKLSNCDWRVAIDAPLSETQKQSWILYRQELRDLPSTLSRPLLNIEDVLWPLEPA